MVPVAAELLDQEGRRIRLTDPSGGYFDTAGDFDRLIGHGSESLVVWTLVDAADVVLTAPQMPGLLADVRVLLAMARPGAEERGLLRLLAMVEACAGNDTFSIRFLGD